jgi:hypothetical protein
LLRHFFLDMGISMQILIQEIFSPLQMGNSHFWILVRHYFNAKSTENT